MKFNIKGIDIEKLNDEIHKYSITDGDTPYIFANDETIKELDDKTGEISSFVYPLHSKYKIALYRACKVFIDNTKEFGEIELR